MWFGAWIAVSSILFVDPLIALVRLSFSNDNASYLLLIPFLAAWIFFIERKSIFLNPSYNAALGGVFLFLTACSAVSTRLLGSAWSPDFRLTGYVLALMLTWIAGFAFFFGRAAVKEGYFPLFFLVLTVPLPNLLLNRIIYFLQEGSAWITGAFFDLFGVPALREGFVFHLARVNIEVAKECSGIRSSMVLLILALLVAHFCLKSFGNKVLFITCGLLMMILKNGIRIATLTLLAVYVDPGFLTGKLHHEGGIVFFLLGLLLLSPVLLLLQRGESGRPMAAQP
jgi:exosortase